MGLHYFSVVLGVTVRQLPKDCARMAWDVEFGIRGFGV